jgi:hypothetical protein
MTFTQGAASTERVAGILARTPRTTPRSRPLPARADGRIDLDTRLGGGGIGLDEPAAVMKTHRPVLIRLTPTVDLHDGGIRQLVG